MEPKTTKLKVVRVELTARVPMPDGTPDKDSLVPLETLAGVLEIRPSNDTMKFPGWIVRNPRNGHEVHVPPHMVKAVVYVPES